MKMKMLAHLHMLVHTHGGVGTLWEGDGGWRVERGLGSSLPAAELARRDSALFEKMRCIFSIAPMESLEKLRVKKHSPDAASEAPDVAPECLVRSRFW